MLICSFFFIVTLAHCFSSTSFALRSAFNSSGFERLTIVKTIGLAIKYGCLSVKIFFVSPTLLSNKVPFTNGSTTLFAQVLSYSLLKFLAMPGITVQRQPQDKGVYNRFQSGSRCSAVNLSNSLCSGRTRLSPTVVNSKYSESNVSHLCAIIADWVTN